MVSRVHWCLIVSYLLKELKIQPSLNSQLIPPQLSGEVGEGGAGAAVGGQRANQEADKQAGINNLFLKK